MPGGRGKEQSICLSRPSIFTPLALSTRATVPRRRRLRMHLEGLPRVVHGAAYYFFVFFTCNFFALQPIQRRGLKLCGPFAHVRVCADGVSNNFW